MTATDSAPSRVVRTYAGLDRRARRRLLVRTLVRAGLTMIGLVVLYYVLPLDGSGRALAVDFVVGGIVFLSVAGLNIWRVTTSTYSLLLALDDLPTVDALFLLLLAASYFQLEAVHPNSFSEP